ncbi:uncharacterized protein MONOS_10494 [Monocercomonoides exilis]|uniref:uncharacterized protein n=1 Tax=Monocercomonoides exilis TaxID=2049356 RepID=UPI00355A80AC|nr:hypothetical protein MONOS_10494 [Monocercomonoides exilis]|eukprot:MONOS_10494.1-p1 / transcript=MONOS_10494.1 / gene=MONOS_10494 / organism=Monocercomonoides_exilis_PA203 / gene_product=unspecified product / transcript_product=unspecified product / location=Mono_scaffold00479:37902-38702(-) / protein_length=205 / sequence_SO=supercontig / SO=protein_coding / is_pseudo=false
MSTSSLGFTEEQQEQIFLQVQEKKNVGRLGLGFATSGTFRAPEATKDAAPPQNSKLESMRAAFRKQFTPAGSSSKPSDLSKSNSNVEDSKDSVSSSTFGSRIVFNESYEEKAHATLKSESEDKDNEMVKIKTSSNQKDDDLIQNDSSALSSDSPSSSSQQLSEVEKIKKKKSHHSKKSDHKKKKHSDKSEKDSKHKKKEHKKRL